jgi:hypothetical protein
MIKGKSRETARLLRFPGAAGAANYGRAGAGAGTAFFRAFSGIKKGASLERLAPCLPAASPSYPVFFL